MSGQLQDIQIISVLKTEFRKRKKKRECIRKQSLTLITAQVQVAENNTRTHTRTLNSTILYAPRIVHVQTEVSRALRYPEVLPFIKMVEETALLL